LGDFIAHDVPDECDRGPHPGAGRFGRFHGAPHLRACARPSFEVEIIALEADDPPVLLFGAANKRENFSHRHLEVKRDHLPRRAAHAIPRGTAEQIVLLRFGRHQVRRERNHASLQRAA